MADNTNDKTAIQAALTIVSNGAFIDVLLAAQCGELAGIGCLCDPLIVSVAETLLRRFTEGERHLLLRTICGCTVHTAAVQTTTTTTPVVNAATVATQPEEPRPSCHQGMPPQGSYTKA